MVTGDDVERVLRASGAEVLSGAADDSHLPDEVLATWVETGAPPTGAYRDHLARCDECRGIYAAMVAAHPAPPSRRAGGWLWRSFGGLALAAAAVLAFIWIPAQSSGPTALRIDVEVIDGPGVVRGEAAVGDRLRLRAGLSELRYHELRVYLQGIGLVLQCPGASLPASCEVDGQVLSAAFTLMHRGRYEVVVIASDAPILGPPVSFESDVADYARTRTQVMDVH